VEAKQRVQEFQDRMRGEAAILVSGRKLKLAKQILVEAEHAVGKDRE
jgi:hypothetical protein